MSEYSEMLKSAFEKGTQIERFKNHKTSVIESTENTTVVHFNNGSFDYSLTFILVKEFPRRSTKLFITGDLGDAIFEFHMDEVTLKKISRIKEGFYLWSKLICSTESIVHDYAKTKESIVYEVHSLFEDSSEDDRLGYEESDVIDSYMNCYDDKGWNYGMLYDIGIPSCLQLDTFEIPDSTELPTRFYLWFIALRTVVEQMEVIK